MQSNFTTYTDKDNKQQWHNYPAPQKNQGLMSQWLDNLNNRLATAHNQDTACGFVCLIYLEVRHNCAIWNFRHKKST